jgi:putative ABC transport system ATP-binding protein
MVSEVITAPAIQDKSAVKPRRAADSWAARFAGSPIAIESRQIVKRYKSGEVELVALRGVDLQVHRGEMVAIMGPSGCGKTTLLNCLSGLDEVDDGEILIQGTDISTLSDNERTDIRARNMGFVFQFYNLLPVLSAVENVELPLLVSGVKPGEARKRAMDSLATVGVVDWAHHKPAQLSGGQRQRVTIARSLVNDPAIVWADEPTGDLDSTNAEEIVRLMKSLNREKGQTFLMVTHDPGVGRSNDRILRMLDGLVIAEEFPGEASNE